MRNLSFFNINATAAPFSISILVTVPNFTLIWVCLTLVWQHVTFIWIINEKNINFQHKCHSSILFINISHYTKFDLNLSFFDTTIMCLINGVGANNRPGLVKSAKIIGHNQRITLQRVTKKSQKRKLTPPVD